MRAIMVSRWGLPWAGIYIEVRYAPDFNDEFPDGAANGEDY